MQYNCDRVSISDAGEAGAIVIVDDLLFENESQLQLEFQIAAKSMDSVFGASDGAKLRKLLAWRTCFGEKSGCPR